MKKRMVVVLGALFVFVAAIGAVKYGQIKKGIAQQKAFKMPPEAVTTTVVKDVAWSGSIEGIGTVNAVHGVTVAADLPGLVSKINFESGQSVKEGQVLVQLDTKQEQAQLAAAEAQVQWTKVSLDRLTGLRGKGIAAQSEWDKADAEQKQAVANVEQTRATIARKTIRAPFTGVLGIRQVNLGQYLAAGAPIVPLQSLDPIYVNFSVPQQQASLLKPGAEVKVKAEGAGVVAAGKLTAQNSIIDSATRNVEVQATFAEPAGPAAPGHVRHGLGRPGHRGDRDSDPRVGGQLRALRRFGLRRRGDEGAGRAGVQGRAPAVREARLGQGRPGRRARRASSPARRS